MADPTLLNRIFKLEDSHTDIKVDIATITERIDSGFVVLGEKLDEFKSSLINTSEKVDGLCVQVAAIEAKNIKKQALKDKLWKGFWAIAMVDLGAGIKFAFELLK
jgi:hypothetical protein